MEKCWNFVYRHINFGENPGQSTSRRITFKPTVEKVLQNNQISLKCCSLDGINLVEKYGIISKRHWKVLKHKCVKKTPKTFRNVWPKENLASFIALFLLANQAILYVYKHWNWKNNIRCRDFVTLGYCFFKNLWNS